MPNQVSISCPKCGFTQPEFSFFPVKGKDRELIVVQTFCPDCDYSVVTDYLNYNTLGELIYWSLSQTSYTDLLKRFDIGTSPVVFWGSGRLDFFSTARKILPCLSSDPQEAYEMASFKFLKLQRALTEILLSDSDLFDSGWLIFPSEFASNGGGDAMDSLAKSHISRKH